MPHMPQLTQWCVLAVPAQHSCSMRGMRGSRSPAQLLAPCWPPNRLQPWPVLPPEQGLAPVWPAAAAAAGHGVGCLHLCSWKPATTSRRCYWCSMTGPQDKPTSATHLCLLQPAPLACRVPVDCSGPHSPPPPPPPNSPGCPLQGLPFTYAHVTIDSPASPPVPAAAAAPRPAWGRQALCPSSCGWRHRQTHRWQQSQALQQTSGHELGHRDHRQLHGRVSPGTRLLLVLGSADAMTTEQEHSMQA